MKHSCNVCNNFNDILTEIHIVTKRRIYVYHYAVLFKDLSSLTIRIQLITITTVFNFRG